MIFRRRRYGEVVERQLELFVSEDGDLLEDVDRALERYNLADADDAEELYGDYQLALEAATEALADARDRYGGTLAEELAERYEDEFNRAAAKRYPAIGVDLPNT